MDEEKLKEVLLTILQGLADLFSGKSTLVVGQTEIKVKRGK